MRRHQAGAAVALTIVLVSFSFGAPPGTQRATQPAASGLSVDGVGLTARRFSLDELRALPRTELTVTDKDGGTRVYAGVRAADVMREAGMKFGQSLRGDRLADYLLVEGAGAYRVVFALTELDAEFTDGVLLLAYSMDGAPLSERDGPLRLIVSDEKKHARWVRGVTRLTIASAGK